MSGHKRWRQLVDDLRTQIETRQRLGLRDEFDAFIQSELAADDSGERMAARIKKLLDQVVQRNIQAQVRLMSSIIENWSSADSVRVFMDSIFTLVYADKQEMGKRMAKYRHMTNDQYNKFVSDKLLESVKRIIDFWYNLYRLYTQLDPIGAEANHLKQMVRLLRKKNARRAIALLRAIKFAQISRAEQDKHDFVFVAAHDDDSVSDNMNNAPQRVLEYFLDLDVSEAIDLRNYDNIKLADDVIIELHNNHLMPIFADALSTQTDSSSSESPPTKQTSNDSSSSKSAQKQQTPKDSSSSKPPQTKQNQTDSSSSKSAQKQQTPKDSSSSKPPQKQQIPKDSSSSKPPQKQQTPKDSSGSKTPQKQQTPKDSSSSKPTQKQQIPKDSLSSKPTQKQQIPKDSKSADKQQTPRKQDKSSSSDPTKHQKPDTPTPITSSSRSKSLQKQTNAREDDFGFPDVPEPQSPPKSVWSRLYGAMVDASKVWPVSIKD